MVFIYLSQVVSESHQLARLAQPHSRRSIVLYQKEQTTSSTDTLELVLRLNINCSEASGRHWPLYMDHL